MTDQVNVERLRANVAEHAALVESLESLLPTVATLGSLLCDAFTAGGRVYTFGNGGSAADAQHLAAELIGRYRGSRRPLPALSLATDPSVVTCIANDFGYEDVFARQVTGLARPGDVVIGFTTTGRSPSVVAGLAAGQAVGASTVLVGGGGGGDAANHADLALLVPSSTTARVQEMHLVLLHLVSEVVEAWAIGDSATGSVTGLDEPELGRVTLP